MWRCQYCETFNRDDAVICEVCGNSKGSQAKMPEAVPPEPVQAHVILDQQPAAGYAEAPVQQPQPVYQPAPAAPVTPVPPQPVEEPAAPRKKRGWVIWLVVILVVLIGGGAASWFMFEEEIRTFIADFTGGDEAETDGAEAVNTGIAQEGIPSLPAVDSETAAEPSEAPTANTNVFSMGGGFMNNLVANAQATAEATAEATVEATVEATMEPAGAPTVPADYVPPQVINAQSPVEDIIYIQNKLCELGLLNDGAYTPGLYDTATATGVINFQRLINNERGYTVLSENGECDALTLSYVELYMNTDHSPVVNYVRYSVDVAMKDEPLIITVSSNVEANTLIMYREKGNEVKSWTAGSNSQVSGNERIWNVEYAFEGVGDRSISFAVSNDGGVSVGVSADAHISVATPVPSTPPSISSVVYNITDAVLGEPVVITAKTNVEANHLVMYSEDGRAPGKWYADGKSVVEGDVRVWTVEFRFNGVGTRALEFAASNDNGTTFSEHYAAPVIKISAVNVNAAEALQTIAYANENVSFAVRSDAKARYLHAYDENMQLLNTWNADEASVVEGTDRVWTVNHAFAGSGDCKLIFAASFDNENIGAAVEAHMNVAGNAPVIVSAAFDAPSALIGEPVGITIKTNADTAKLIMRSEKGDAAKTWEAEGNSTVNGTERIWNVSYPFISAGNRLMTFFAERADGTASNGFEAPIEIITIPAKISRAAADKPTAVIGENITFTIESNVNADNLVMYSENGKAAWNWKADKNSTVEGDKRIWNVQYSFKGKGNRKMSFVVENAYDGEVSEAVSVTVSIVPVEVTAAAFINSVAYCEEYVTITVITDASANFLHMYKEDMKEVTKWNAAECSSVSGQKRTWNVNFKFSTEGIRGMSFAASYDGENPGDPCEPKLITIAKDQPGVGFIHCDKEEANKGDRLIITVKTNADANMLMLKDEGGNVVTSWLAETEGISIINGTERIWTIEYRFNSPGERKVFFCASRDAGETMGLDCEMNILIK